MKEMPTTLSETQDTPAHIGEQGLPVAAQPVKP